MSLTNSKALALCSIFCARNESLPISIRIATAAASRLSLPRTSKSLLYALTAPSKSFALVSMRAIWPNWFGLLNATSEFNAIVA